MRDAPKYITKVAEKVDLVNQVQFFSYICNIFKILTRLRKKLLKILVTNVFFFQQCLLYIPAYQYAILPYWSTE